MLIDEILGVIGFMKSDGFKHLERIGTSSLENQYN
jgi:hypothetical protein